MSKQFIAAREQQGCSIPSTLPKRPVSVKKIRNQIGNELLDTIRLVSDKNYKLSILMDTILGIAESDTPDYKSFSKIRELASVCIGMSDDIGDQLDKAPTILAAVGGAA